MGKKQAQQNNYRACFLTDEGRRVLGHLLIEGGYFDTDLKSPEDIAVQNFVKKILKNMGVHKLSNIDSYVNMLFQLPTEG